MKKIRKNEARKLFYEGKTIFLLPSKTRWGGMWIKEYALNINIVDVDDSTSDITKAFDNIINSYEYYYCNYECGYNAAYYIED